MTALRIRMIQDMKLRNLSDNTQESYVRAVVKFAEYFGKSPELASKEDVRTYLVHLVEVKQASTSHYVQVLCALRFFYNRTLQNPEILEGIPCPKGEFKLPVVLSMEEVSRFLDAIKNLKHRALFMTIYAGGLRSSEAVSLRVVDIDSQRMLLHIRQGKGKKDRYVNLSARLLDVLPRISQMEMTTACFPRRFEPTKTRV